MRVVLLLGLVVALVSGCGRVAAQIENYSPSELLEVELGDAVTLSVTFKNTGNRAREFIARVAVLDHREVVVRSYEEKLRDPLEPGQRTTVNWEHKFRQAGEYLVQFSLLGDPDTTLGQQPDPAQRLVVVREVEPEPEEPRATAKFQVGDRVEVVDDPLRVRVAPGTGERDVSSPHYPGSMPVGSTGRVVDGPVEADGYIWWRIDYDAGVVGWSAQNWLAHRNGNG